MIQGALVFVGICLVIAAFILVSVRAFQIHPELVKKIFKYMIIISIAAAFSIAAVAIGLRISDRNSSSMSKNYRSVTEIWGGEVLQRIPSFYTESYIDEQYIEEKTGQYKNRRKIVYNQFGFASHSSDILVSSNIRQKGVLKFAGYNLKFSGKYEFANMEQKPGTFYFYFPLPENAGNISDLKVFLNGKEYRGDTNLADGVNWTGYLAPGERVAFLISYAAQGTGSFRYGRSRTVNEAPSKNSLHSGGKVEIASFSAKLKTDFKDISLLDGTMSPVENVSDSSGSMVNWSASKLILDQDIGLRFEISANYGSLFSKIFFYAPLVIFLFISFLLIFTSSSGIRLHPMHYIFITAGFFVFYLLGSYAVSFMHILAAILLSLAVSTLITWYYSRSIGKGRALEKITLLCLGVFQWFFSAAFFFPEYTGLLITLASIGALVVLMKITAKTDWEGKW